jgi:hypothetical protein
VGPKLAVENVSEPDNRVIMYLKVHTGMTGLFIIGLSGYLTAVLIVVVDIT